MDSLNKWFVHPLKNQFADFEGRSTVEQYWMFTLWYFIFSILLELIGQEAVSVLYGLVLLIPGLAFGTRRLHDIGKSGWWQLLWFIPIIGWIILMVFLVTKGESGANNYGPNPGEAVAPAPIPVPPAESAIHNDNDVDTNPK